MIGAIAGDIIGSVYELQPLKSEDFPLFAQGSSFTERGRDDRPFGDRAAEDFCHDLPAHRTRGSLFTWAILGWRSRRWTC